LISSRHIDLALQAKIDAHKSETEQLTQSFEATSFSLLVSYGNSYEAKLSKLKLQAKSKLAQLKKDIGFVAPLHY
jgi:hypothetical protein